MARLNPHVLHFLTVNVTVTVMLFTCAPSYIALSSQSHCGRNSSENHSKSPRQQKQADTPLPTRIENHSKSPRQQKQADTPLPTRSGHTAFQHLSIFCSMQTKIKQNLVFTAKLAKCSNSTKNKEKSKFLKKTQKHRKNDK